MRNIQNTMKKLLIGGQALRQHGSSRHTEDTYYLVCIENNYEAFIHDDENNIDYCNAEGNAFFAKIWESEKDSIETASPQALFELKAYSFVQHCLNMNFKKADEAEFDMKFLVREFGVEKTFIVQKFVAQNEMNEINKIIKSTKI